MDELIVGIDLGTTNSALAVVINGSPKVIDIHGQPSMPSCVGLDPEGRLIVGQAAKNQIVAAPDSTIASIKRMMGEDVRVSLSDKEYSPEEISAFILRELKNEGEKAIGHPIRKAVITVPAFFNEHQRKATQVAGEIAGLDVVRIVNEPTAAALAYGAGREKDETLLVYDLGGGTFDVSLVVAEQDVVEVKASHGDTKLGGDDFDHLLAEYAMLEFQKTYNRDLHQDPAVLRRLTIALERAKCRLSDEPFVPVREEYITKEDHLDLEIQRTEYEEMIHALLEKTLVCVNQTLQDAGMSPKDIDKVMLVGGSTRTPLVHQLLSERLQIEPRWEIDPDLIVAMGAAVQGAIIGGKETDSVLVDITPHTFSTAVVGFINGYEQLMCVPLIRRNTPLPASKSERFQTFQDYQESVLVQAYQGESQFPTENAFIGEFLIDGLSQVPAGNTVVLHFKLDLNGMLHVTATEKSTGLNKTVVMDTKKKGSTVDADAAKNAIQAMMKDTEEWDGTIEVMDSPPEDADRDAILVTARDLKKRGDALVSGSLKGDDAREIRELIHASAGAIKGQDWSLLIEKNNTLADLLFYLED
ncbi:MAG TPA: heat-shock protein Hsp70 [Verrucomicrobiales bacterium]|jgi:molecular chaperone DnaK|nr:heat-shock protein Hsp70 [Verrucomicrobiales bacterium]HIL70190.1 heat-shock protein Hsp70 [Verrucomicrobiota bacterium]